MEWGVASEFLFSDAGIERVSGTYAFSIGFNCD